MEFYDEHTGITVYSKANSDRYRDVTYTMYTSSGDSIGNISYNYINNIKSVIGSDGNYYVAVPYDSNWYTNDYS